MPFLPICRRRGTFNIIEFDGKSWSLMDPTLAAGNSRSSLKKYGDGVVKVETGRGSSGKPLLLL
jgi:hypothetical protein